MSGNKAKASKRGSHVTQVFGHFLDIGGPRTGTWILSLLELEGCPSIAELKNIFADRLLSMTRFKSVMKVVKGSVVFEEIEEIDWDYHLTTIFEDKEVEEEDVLEFLEDILSFGFDKEKPLWRAILVPNCSNGRSNLIFVINHAVADGVASLGVLFKLIDDSPIDPTLSMTQQAGAAGLKKRKKAPEASNWSKFTTFFGGLYRGLAFPLMSADSENAFRLKVDILDEKQYKGKKKFGKAEDMELEHIKALKKKFAGATVNDILLSLLTIAVKTFLQEIDDPILKKNATLRGNFPVSMRGKDDAILKDNNPSNTVQALAFPFPLKYESPVDCVWKVKELIDRTKISPELPLQNAVNKAIVNTLPRIISLPLFAKTGTMASMMLSNVPGPQQLVHLAGFPVRDLSFYLIAPIGTYLGVLTYNGKVRLTVNFDETLGLEPEKFAKHWAAALETLTEDVSKYEEMIPKDIEERKKYLSEN